MDALADLLAADAPTRMFSGDHTLWAPDPTEITNRLGWLSEPQRMVGEITALQHFVDDVRGAGIDRVLWCGMGGSSLFPELLATSALTAQDAPAMLVLDSSHPTAVLRAHEFAAQAPTLVVVASKSGGTIETRSHLDYLWDALPGGDHFAAVTDAGSALDSLASERAFRGVFHANPNIGGRFSALSHFGLVAAALLGVDLAALLAGATTMLERCRTNEATNPGLALGALMGAGALVGRDKVVLDCDPAFAAWLEQLVAESTGKHGVGILPVPGGTVDADGPDRLRVSYDHGGELDLGPDAGGDLRADARVLGGELVRWEVATALAGAVLRINPFDQPDVEAAKRAAGQILDGTPATIPLRSLEEALAGAGPGGYVTLQAFVDPAGPTATVLGAARIALRDRTGAAATAAVGPRYLHSTGQLHKGGPHTGWNVQCLDTDLPVVPVPGRSFGFAELLGAQAAGDFAALEGARQRVARVTPEALQTAVAR